MSYEVALPDGRVVEFPDDVPRDRAAQIIREQLLTPSKPKKGLLAAAEKGLESVVSSGRTAYEALTGSPEEAARRGIERGEDIEKRFADQVSLERVKKAYAERGLLPAAGEVISQIPAAIAEQAPNIATALGGARLGATLGGVAGPVGAIVGGVAGAAAPSLIQQFGGNIERQAREQQARGEPVQISREAALGAAVPQAALDVAGTFIPLGGRLVSKLTGIPAEALLGRSAAQVEKLANERLLKTLAKGTAVGAVAEIPTEIAQQMLERAQAGLSLTSPDALKEYGETAYQVGLLAPIGAAGRLAERGGARQEVEARQADEARRAQEAELAQQAEDQRKAAELAAADEARKQTPEYALEFGQQYDALQKQYDTLRKSLKKPGADATVEDKVTYKDTQAKVKDLYKQLAQQTPEYQRIKSVYQDELDRLRKEQVAAEEQRQAEMEQAAAPGQAAAVEPFFEAPQQTLFGFEGEAAPTAEAEAVDYAAQARNLSARLDDLRTQAQTTTNLDEKLRLGEEFTKTEKALKEASELAKRAAPATADRQIGLLRKKMAVAEEEGDLAAQVKIAQQLKDLGVTDLKEEKAPEQGVLDLGRAIPFAETREKARQAEMAEEMGKREALLKAPVLPDEEQQYQELIDFAEESRAAASEDMRHLDEQFVKALTTDTPAIEVSDKIGMQPRAVQLRERIENLFAAADQADADYRAAKSNNQKGAATAAFERGKAAVEQLDALASTGGEYVKQVIAARKAQTAAFGKLQDIAEQLRTEQTLGGANKKMAASTEQTLLNEANRQRSLLIVNALEEAAMHRQAAGRPALTRDEAVKAASKLYDSVNDWMSRAQVRPEPAQYEDVVVQPAQMRGAKIVRPAVTERRVVKEAVQGISPAENKHFQTRINAVRQQLLTLPEAKLRVESPLLKRQFAATEAQKVAEARGETAETIGGQLRRRTEYVRDKMARMGLTPSALKGYYPISRMLNKAADVMDAGNATNVLLDAVEPVVDAIAAKREIKQVDLRAISDALRAAEPTAIEQKEAGQKSLFPETEKDLGYIRMTPKAFANSPKIKPVWEALEKAEAASKRRAAKETLVKQRSKAAVDTLERLRDEVDRIKNDTKFFWTNISTWTNADMAKAYAGFPDIGNTPEEQALVDRYLKGTATDRAAFSDKDRKKVNTLFEKFRTVKMPAYEARFNEALTLLAQRQRLEDLDNQLLQTMQDTNKSVNAAAAEQRKELAVLRNAIEQVESLFKSDSNARQDKRVIELEKKAAATRAKYDERVAQLYNAAHKRMDDALAEILDPEIKRAREDLEKAKKTLAKEKEELERTQKRVQDVLTQPEGKDRMLLATYQQFKYEEKKGVIEDLEKRIEDQEAELQDLLDTRFEAHDAAAAALEAVNDKKVQSYRDRVVALEAQLAELRGEKVTAKQPGGKGQLPTLRYPFAAQKYEADLKAAQASLTAAKKQQVETKEQIKSQAQQMEEFWQGKLGGAGIQRKAGRVEPLVTAEQKRLEQLRREQRENDDRAFAAEEKQLAKDKQIESLDQQVAGLIEELGAFEDFPNELAELKELAYNEALPQAERDAALAKAGIIQNITSLEAQRDVLLEDAPPAKRRAATVASSSAMAKQKPLRTGYRKALEEVSEARKKERADLTGTREADTALGAFGVEDIGDLFAVKQDRLFQAANAAATGPALKTPIDTNQSAAVAMADLAKTTKDPVSRAIAERLKLLLGQTRIEIVDDLRDDKGDPVFGGATVDGRLISLDRGAGLNEQTLLHEGIHAATERVLRLPDAELTEDQRAAKRELEELYKAYVADNTAPDNKNAKSSMSEFLSEALSDNAVKLHLQSKPWTLKNMWESLKNGILQMLGIKTPKNMLEATLAAADRLMTRVPRSTKGDMYLAVPKLSRPKNLSPELQAALGTADQIVAKQRPWSDKIKANATGLAFETQLVDRFAGFERLAKYMDKLKGMQMLYYLRMYDQRMNFVAQSVGTGALDLVKKTRKDGQTEYVVESQPGASIAGVARILRDANPILGTVDNTNKLFTMYLAAKRAERVGFAKLNFGSALTEPELRKAMASIAATPGLQTIFERARNEYNKYNQGLVRFAEKTGALSKETADALLATNDYIPYYRARQDGMVELLIGGETPITVGSIKSQPYLQDLIGGDTAILDFMRSSVQNTNMLVDMSLRNLATKNAMYELVNLGAAKLTGATSGKDVVQFKEDGQDKYAVIDTGKFDIPADLLVKGMEGIPLQTTGLVHMMALPAKFLRKAITLNPLYSARQLFRDSLAAYVMSGADMTPVLGALKEIGGPAAKTLERRGIVGGQQFTGTQEDLSLILRQITSGKGSLASLLGKAEAFSMEADALTRRAQYNAYVRQGLSEMEATLLSLESMNFNKRGASPSVHLANSLIPFFNAQIQGLNVLYKAMFGKASVAEKARIKEKLLTRGLMLMAISLAYTQAMQDDEAYKNALPDQKYGNWLIRIPGVDEPLRLPIPFEIGYIFKALPEAIYNSMMSKEGAEGAQEAMLNILRNVIPGGSSYFVPQAAKPAIEALLNRSFFTGRDIVSSKEQKLLPEAQYRDSTTELAKLFGGAGISPIKLEALINGYTGPLGMAVLGALSLPISPADSPEKAAKRLSDLPVVGGAFQPNDASWIINNTYDSLKEAQQVEQTFKEYLARGEKAKAVELINTRANEYATANFGDYYAQTMRKLTQLETAIKASDRTPEEKRQMLDKIKQEKIKFASMVRDATEKTKPQ